MSTFMSWLVHRGRTHAGSGDVSRTSRRLLEEEIGQGQRMQSLTTEDGPDTGLPHPSGGPLFVGFEALAHRQNALFEGLTPVQEKAALITFVGMGITDPNRYQDAATAFNQLRLMAPAQEGALIHVFTHKLREESKGSDFLYLHFGGDPLSFGFLICVLRAIHLSRLHWCDALPRLAGWCPVPAFARRVPVMVRHGRGLLG